jgi:hypothetical protein
LPASSPTERWRAGNETAVVADRVVDRQAVDLADQVVVGAVRRGGVHQAGAGFEGDVPAADDRHVARLEGVFEQHLFERGALGRADHRAGQRVTLQAGFGQFAHEDQRALRRVDQVVVEIRVGADRLVGRQRPRRRRPDDGEGRAAQVA